MLETEIFTCGGNSSEHDFGSNYLRLKLLMMNLLPNLSLMSLHAAELIPLASGSSLAVICLCHPGKQLL